jgi:hypothetical protein
MTMTRFCKSITLSLACVALLSACSRPMATFQASKPVHYYTSQAAKPVGFAAETPSVKPDENPADQPTATAPVATEQTPVALASLEARHATDRRMTRRLERMENQLAENRLAPTAPAGVKKTSLIQRIVLKKMAKKIHHQLAPNQTKELTGTARLGLIIAAVGLLLLLIGNGFGSILGLIALLAGGALFVYALLQE